MSYDYGRSFGSQTQLKPLHLSSLFLVYALSLGYSTKKKLIGLGTGMDGVFCGHSLPNQLIFL